MSLRRAIIFSSIERYFGFVLAFASTIAIARLLSPSEVGAFSVAMSISGIASGLRELGASSFLIRAPRMEPTHKSCAFGLTLFLGLALGISMLLLATPVAIFFREDSLRTLLQILSINFFLLPFGTINNALIQREMHFDLLAKINVIGTLLGFIVSIGLAWEGYGASSLAWGAVALAVSSTALSILWGPEPLLIRPRLSGSSALIRFGSQMTAHAIIMDIGLRLPDFVIGKVQGLYSTGLFSRATGVASNVNDLLLRGLGGVALSYFSKVEREKGDVVQIHIRMGTLVTGLGWPAYAGLAFFAEPITLILFGEKWLAIVWPLRIICLQLAIELPFSFQYQVVVAKGKLGRQLASFITATVVRVMCVVIGANWGVSGAATGLVAAQFFATIISSRIVWPYIGVTWGHYVGVMRTNLLPLLVAIVASALAQWAALIFELSHWETVLWFGPLAFLAVMASLGFSRHSLAIEVTTLLNDLRKSRAS